MGIPIIPPDSRFENWMWLKTSGIEKGLPWVEEPPNRIFKCWRNIVGDYIYIGTDWVVSVVWSAPYTSITVYQYYYNHIAYSFNVSKPNQYYGKNAITSPTARWRFGNHMIYFYDPSGAPNTLQAQANQIGVGNFPKLFAEPISGSDSNRTVRFARRNDGTCIYMKQE